MHVLRLAVVSAVVAMWLTSRNGRIFVRALACWYFARDAKGTAGPRNRGLLLVAMCQSRAIVSLFVVTIAGGMLLATLYHRCCLRS